MGCEHLALEMCDGFILCIWAFVKNHAKDTIAKGTSDLGMTGGPNEHHGEVWRRALYIHTFKGEWMGKRGRRLGRGKGKGGLT
jgi:hypothetical protein